MNDSAKEGSPAPTQMRLKIGVMDGAGNDIPESHLERAKVLGESIAASDCIVITGACPGLPLAAARGAFNHGGMVIGICCSSVSVMCSGWSRKNPVWPM